MTKNKKLGMLVCAMVVNAIGMGALARPADALSLQQCTDTQQAYAQGFSDATCASQGYSTARVTSCNQANGSYTWNFACS